CRRRSSEDRLADRLWAAPARRATPVALGWPRRSAIAIQAGGERGPARGQHPRARGPIATRRGTCPQVAFGTPARASPCFGAQEASERAESAGDFEIAGDQTDV